MAPSGDTRASSQIHAPEQGVPARIGAVGVEGRIVMNNEKHRIALLVGRVERLKHRIHFAGGGVIIRSAGCAAVRSASFRANSWLRSRSPALW
jgi:serine/threonine protein kinase